MAESPFGLVVRFTLADGAAAAFDQLVEETITKIRTAEPGTLVYAVHDVEGEPQTRIFYELYADRAAFDRHEEQEHVKHFLRERAQYLTDTHVDFLALRADKGIPAVSEER